MARRKAALLRAGRVGSEALTHVLRRFEMYSLRDHASPDAVARLRTALRDCARFIPEVLHSAIGTNLSSAPVDLVWEHAYDSPEAYRRYMVHPFHACVLDRYLLRDSPERVVSDNDLGAGLLGYECDRPDFFLRAGVRRIVLLQIASETTAADLAALATRLRDAQTEAPELAVSIFAENTFANRWFDGVTPITPPSRWTHLWEQGFRSADELSRYRLKSSELASADRSSIVRRTATVEYIMDPGFALADD